jgi:hypothetical protein
MRDAMQTMLTRSTCASVPPQEVPTRPVLETTLFVDGQARDICLPDREVAAMEPAATYNNLEGHWQQDYEEAYNLSRLTFAGAEYGTTLTTTETFRPRPANIHPFLDKHPVIFAEETVLETFRTTEPEFDKTYQRYCQYVNSLDASQLPENTRKSFLLHCRQRKLNRNPTGLVAVWKDNEVHVPFSKKLYKSGETRWGRKVALQLGITEEKAKFLLLREAALYVTRKTVKWTRPVAGVTGPWKVTGKRDVYCTDPERRWR